MTHQTWDPDQYARAARFVSDLGAGVVDLLSPKPGERILDLGCGDGALTEKMVALGCEVVGVDSSKEQIAAARSKGLDAHVADARRLAYDGEFDAVFSNAALHWIDDISAVVGGVRRALKPGGRFVGEFGGHGNIRSVVTALYTVLDRHGVDGRSLNPWNFPGEDTFHSILDTHGFETGEIRLFPRPTLLPGPIEDWINIFCKVFLSTIPEANRVAFIGELAGALRPSCYKEGRGWTLDYVRLRFSARRSA